MGQLELAALVLWPYLLPPEAYFYDNYLYFDYPWLWSWQPNPWLESQWRRSRPNPFDGPFKPNAEHYKPGTVLNEMRREWRERQRRWEEEEMRRLLEDLYWDLKKWNDFN